MAIQFGAFSWAFWPKMPQEPGALPHPKELPAYRQAEEIRQLFPQLVVMNWAWERDCRGRTYDS